MNRASMMQRSQSLQVAHVMTLQPFDRARIRTLPIRQRENRVTVDDLVRPSDTPRSLSVATAAVIDETAERIRRARETNRARMLVFGAHTIKNGLSPVLIGLIEHGWITHLATNGAGIIHDWELAYLGATSEHVRENVARGEFGTWEETGKYLNLAITVGAHQGLGYGESIGRLVEHDGLEIPSPDELHETIRANMDSNAVSTAAAADLLACIQQSDIPAGRLTIEHPHKSIGLQAAAYRYGVPFTGHPMIGQDIIYEHPISCGAAIGRTAERDFLAFVRSVAGLDGGVYLSIGSAVMSPMLFEKSLNMARNVALQDGQRIDNLYICVADLQESAWDWSRGEPPETDPAYYLRFNKTFARMGGLMHYVAADNRDVLLALTHALGKGSG